ncbi:MAG: NADH-quinone oxidoreductase subunit N [Chloroflexi bacterium]|nr:NADH-quinone oxidoreductase subunit N [Chloroflexota bacterium]
MRTVDLYYLSPEISLSILAFAVIILDLFVQRKGWLATVSLLGLFVPTALTLALWGVRTTAFNGFLIVDEFSLFFKLLFIVVAALVILASQDYVSKFPRMQGEYYALVLLAAVGMMLMAASGELITIYIALELNALSLCALVCFLRDARSSEASLKFLLLSAISSAVMLYGMALVFGLTGSTSLRDIAAGLVPLKRLLDEPALLLGLTLIVAGFGFKISTVPFQMWVPDVYEGAPTPITAYLSVASKAAGFAVILRVFYIAFGGMDLDWGMLFAVLSAVSMTIGNIVAIAQSNIKRMLGYSTIAHAGYLMAGLASVSALGIGGEFLGPSGVLFYLGAYAMTNLGAFIAVIAISNKTGSDLIADYAGMARRTPALAFALAFCLISLVGIPPTAGFVAKIYIFNAAVQNGLVWLAIIGVVNSVISAYYYINVVRVMYLRPAASEEAVPSTMALRSALLISVAGVFLLGILPGPLMRLANIAVSVLPVP